ncbi:hypothetical protein LCGC14_1687600 [marine sediment metagenome]|uniref:Uncharacterized protein n=1 Tax=marine sediment metagenome TaxID=412755 RepID=A0A0F9I9A4_9ZZZZ
MATRTKHYGKPVKSVNGYSIRPMYHSITKDHKNRKVTIKVPDGKFGIFAGRKLKFIMENLNDAILKLSKLS